MMLLLFLPAATFPLQNGAFRMGLSRWAVLPNNRLWILLLLHVFPPRCSLCSAMHFRTGVSCWAVSPTNCFWAMLHLSFLPPRFSRCSPMCFEWDCLVSRFGDQSSLIFVGLTCLPTATFPLQRDAFHTGVSCWAVSPTNCSWAMTSCLSFRREFPVAAGCVSHGVAFVRINPLYFGIRVRMVVNYFCHVYWLRQMCKVKMELIVEPFEWRAICNSCLRLSIQIFQFEDREFAYFCNWNAVSNWKTEHVSSYGGGPVEWASDKRIRGFKASSPMRTVNSNSLTQPANNPRKDQQKLSLGKKAKLYTGPSP